MNTNELMDMASAYWKSAALSAAVQTGIFEALSGGSATASDIARDRNTAPEHTEALLDALAGLGILAKADKRYAVCPELQEVLHPDHPASLLDALRFNLDLYGLWGQLTQCVTEGAPALPAKAHLGGNPEMAKRFARGMHSRGRALAPLLLPQIDLGIPAASLLDVAGGPGTFSVLLAEQHPGLKVTVFDLAPIVATGRELHAGSPALDRVTYQGGDYHAEALPGGFDTALYCGALHQETPEQAKKIFGKIYDALNPGGKVWLIDLMVEGDRTQPAYAALFGLNMMLMRPASHMYGVEEAAGLLVDAGFTVQESRRIEPTAYQCLVGEKPA